MRTKPENPPLNGRDDLLEGTDALRLHQRFTPYDAGQTGVKGTVIIGFASDAGIKRNLGRIGAKGGPNAIRAELGGLAFHAQGPLYDAGDVVCEEDELEVAQAELGKVVSEVLANRHLPVVIGGGHEVAYGTFLGLWSHLQRTSRSTNRLAIVNLDAHFDLRKTSTASSGTPFAQIAQKTLLEGNEFHYYCLGISEASNTEALYRTARELGVRYLHDYEMQAVPVPTLNEIIENYDAIYLSVDLDILPASVMPGVSAPSAFGVPLATIIGTIRQLVASNKLLAADVAEYSPPHDTNREGARVAARIVYELLA